MPVSAMVLFVLAAVGLAGPASAAAVTTTFRDAQTGLCLDSAASAVHSDQCAGQASQQWSITPAGNPNVTITNTQTGQCLDSAYQNPAASPVAAVFTDQCDASLTQQWYAEPDSAEDGQLVFMNAQTGMVLDSNDAGAAYANSANGGTYQNWAVTQFPGLPPFTGSSLPTTTTLTDAQTGLCLDGQTGAVQSDQCDGQASQQWSVTAAGNPDVVIANTQTGQCLDSSYPDPANPPVSSIFTSPCDGSSLTQHWFLTGGGGPGGSFVLVNMRTGRLLDSNDAGAVYGHTANGGNYQNWSAAELPRFPAFAAMMTG
jgi:hypothetical protein